MFINWFPRPDECRWLNQFLKINKIVDKGRCYVTNFMECHNLLDEAILDSRCTHHHKSWTQTMECIETQGALILAKLRF